MQNSKLVALVKCGDYGQEVVQSVAEALSLLGGPGKFFWAGQNVLIKPNLLTERTPEQAVTTHPEIVRAVIRLAKSYGANVSVADSPASVVKIKRVFSKTGFTDLCREENVPLLNLEKSGSVAFDTNNFKFSIAKPVLEADLVVNMPKVKTHGFTTLTVGVKNIYGCVPGYQKTNLHKAHPKPNDFGMIMREIFLKVKPGLTIADGIVGMEGEGPSAGNPINLGFVAASKDAVALDVAMCEILGIKIKTVSYLVALLKTDEYRNLAGSLVYPGLKPQDLRPASFDIPGTTAVHLIPKWLIRPFQPFVWIRPRISGKDCIKCMRCVEACPTKALSPGADKIPELTTSLCIGCCCCHEVCPAKAITMMQSPLLNIVRRGRMP